MAIIMTNIFMTKMSNETEATDRDELALTISQEKVCFIIMKAREFGAKDEVTEPDPGSNPSDDRTRQCSKITKMTLSSRRSHR